MVLSVYFQLIVKDGNRRLMQQIGEHFKSVESCNSMYLLFILKSWFCWVSLFVGVDCERVYVYRLWRTVQGEMQSSLKAEPVPQGMWDLLCQMQVRSTWDCRQQGAVRGLLYWHDHPWQQDQVPMSPFIPLKLFVLHVSSTMLQSRIVPVWTPLLKKKKKKVPVCVCALMLQVYKVRSALERCCN